MLCVEGPLQPTCFRLSVFAVPEDVCLDAEEEGRLMGEEVD